MLRCNIVMLWRSQPDLAIAPDFHAPCLDALLKDTSRRRFEVLMAWADPAAAAVGRAAGLVSWRTADSGVAINLHDGPASVFGNLLELPHIVLYGLMVDPATGP